MKSKEIKFLNLVKVKDKLVSEYATLFPSHELFVWLGEIVDQPDHCVVVNYYSGVTYCGYHSDIFRLLKKSEK